MGLYLHSTVTIGLGGVYYAFLVRRKRLVFERQPFFLKNVAPRLANSGVLKIRHIVWDHGQGRE